MLHWQKDWWWSWSWSSNTLATWCEELIHCKRPWCWERLKVGGEGDDRGWNGYMASPTQWTWVWASSRSLWGTRKPSVLQSVGSQRVRHDCATELNWKHVAINMSWCLPKEWEKVSNVIQAIALCKLTSSRKQTIYSNHLEVMEVCDNWILAVGSK